MILEKLKKIRLENGNTLQDVAESIGISKEGYWMIENGKRGLTYENAVKIASFFNKTPDDIFLKSELTNKEQKEVAK